MGSMIRVEELNRDLSPGQLATWRKFVAGEPLSPSKRMMAERWKAQADGKPYKKSPASKSSLTACPDLGPSTGTRVKCLSCANSQEEAFRCNRHGKRTTLSRPAKEDDNGKILCCRYCDDHPSNRMQLTLNESLLTRPIPKITPHSCLQCAGTDLGTVHLVYHILPVAENLTWKWNLAQLAARSKLFTGRKLFAIMTSGDSKRFSRVKDRPGDFTLVPPSEIRRHLPRDAEVVELVNDPALREVVSWNPLWTALLEGKCSGSDKVFYAHAKGVTRTSATVTKWTDLMYSTTLDHPALVDAILQKNKVAGSFRKTGTCFPKCPWHYSGSFFWSTVESMWEALPRTPVQNDWWGNEAWPGQAFPLEESGVLFASGSTADMDLFKPETWHGLDLNYKAWLSDHGVGGVAS